MELIFWDVSFPTKMHHLNSEAKIFEEFSQGYCPIHWCKFKLFQIRFYARTIQIVEKAPLIGCRVRCHPSKRRLVLLKKKVRLSLSKFLGKLQQQYKLGIKAEIICQYICLLWLSNDWQNSSSTSSPLNTIILSLDRLLLSK